ncbi:pyridoxal phosphate-dependent transferase [Entophlyctis helioformis]|nr:pyridoxal phosphate-dependent transferase [Entophlyctis helioformis]
MTPNKRLTEEDYAKFLSPISAARKPSAIRALQNLSFLPDMISLGGGLPDPTTFPFTSLSFTLSSGDKVDMSPKLLNQALQYSTTTGLGVLVDWLRQLQIHVHKPHEQTFDLCVGSGSQDLLTKACEALLKEGDNILVESPTYVGVLSFLKPLGVNFVEVQSDKDGLNPDYLEAVMSNWTDIATRPKVLYTVPVGGNPTGADTTVERKRRIYELACKYNFIILEDDPYYYLQFDDYRESYFSMDTEGRVLRFDSLSKVLSGGARVGWVSGPHELVYRIVLHGMSSNVHPSGISQALMFAVLERWGIDGFLAHSKQVANLYKSKRDVFVELARKHLDGIAEFDDPQTGMFAWIKLLGVHDTFALISTKAVEKKILLVPGQEFLPNTRPSPYVRASFSIAPRDKLELALQRLRELVLEARA